MNNLLEAKSHERHQDYLLQARGLVKHYGNRVCMLDRGKTCG